MERRKYLIRYDPIDSYDSSRRSYFKLFDLPPYKKGVMQESDILVAVEAGAAEAVWKWNQGRAQDSVFGVRTFQKLKGTRRFPGIIIDSVPNQSDVNHLTKSYDTIVSTEPTGQKRVSVVVTPLNDSDRAIARESVTAKMGDVWNTLTIEDRIDSALTLFNITDFSSLDAVDVDFLRAQDMYFGDSVSDNLQGLYGYNDSDWANWMEFEIVTAISDRISTD